MASGVFTAAMVKKGGPSLVTALNGNSYLQHPWQKVLYVQSTHTRSVDLNNAGENPDAPLKTIVKAVSLARAGDTILVGPGHVETVSTAAGLNINKNFLTIVGCGYDGQRPVINCSAVAAYWEISGQGVRMFNFQIAPTIDAVTKLLNISGPSAYLEEFRIDESAAFQSVTAINVTATASGGVIKRLVAEQYTAGATQCILIAGALIEFSILECVLRGNYSAAVISVTAAALQLDIGRNILANSNAANVGILCGAVAASGEIYNNYITLASAVVVVTVAITLGSGIWRLYENYGTDTAGLTGVLCGVAAT